MGTITGFRGEAKSRSTGSMKVTIRVFAEWIAALNEKPGLDAMEGRSIEKFYFGQVDEIFDMSGGIIREKAKLDLPKSRRDRGFGVFLFKLN